MTGLSCSSLYTIKTEDWCGVQGVWNSKHTSCEIWFPRPLSFAPENLVSRDEFGRPVSRQPTYSSDSNWIWQTIPFRLLQIISRVWTSFSTRRIACPTPHAKSAVWVTTHALAQHVVGMYIWSSHRSIAENWLTRIRLPIMLVVSWTGKNNISCLRSRQRIWSRKTGSAVPSRPVPRQPAHAFSTAAGWEYRCRAYDERWPT